MAGIVYKSQGVKNTEVNHDLHSVINKTDHKKVLTAIRNSPEIQQGEITNFNEWFLNDPGFVQSIIQRECDGERDIGITPDMLLNAEPWHRNDYWGDTGSDPSPDDTPDKISSNWDNLPNSQGLQYCSLTGIFNGNFKANQFYEDENSLYDSMETPKKLTIRRFDQVSKKDGKKDFNHKNCLMLFNDLKGDDSNNLNVFFIVDVGDRCIKTMTTGDPKIGFPIDDSKGVSLDTFLPFDNYNAYHIHTTTTYSDSASKMSAEDPWYDKTFIKQHKTLDQRKPKLPLVRACMITKNIEIGDGTKDIHRDLFMSDYNAIVGWRVPTMNNRSSTFQSWTHSDPTVTNPNYGTYTTYNPKKDNNKPSVEEWLRESKKGAAGAAGSDVSYGRLLKNFEEKYDERTDDENRVSLEVQKKRSGDAWQILTALNMYKMVKQDEDLKLVRPKELAPTGTDLFSNLTTDDAKKKYFKTNTIFITSDWPALAFALSLGVNCIMCFFYPSDENKKCFFSFIFDDEDTGTGAELLGPQMDVVAPALDKYHVLEILQNIADVSKVSEKDKQYVLRWIDSEGRLNDRFNLEELYEILDNTEIDKKKLYDLLIDLKIKGTSIRRPKFLKPKITKKGKARKKTKRKKKKSKRKTNRKKKKSKKKTKKKSLKKILMNFLN